MRKTLHHAFTLVELLAVMVIILILATITLRVAGMTQNKGKLSKAENDMQRLCIGMEEMRNDYGDYYGSGGAFRGTNVGGVKYFEGLNTKDPWGGTYQIGVIVCTSPNDPDEVFSKHAGKCINFNYHRDFHWYKFGSNGTDGAEEYISKVRAHCQEYFVASMGPDKRPGKAKIDDDADGSIDDPGSYNNDDYTELGYGDDIVRGNSTQKKNFKKW